MASLDLRGPRLKLARAKHHIRDLESLLDAFISDSPHRIETEEDDKGIRIVGRFERPIPVETAAIIGDAIHNIRVALDHLVAAAVVANGALPTESNAFPMYKKKRDLERQSGRKLVGCSDAFTSYVHSLEPYGSGKGQEIYAISKLDNMDKHTTLVPVIAVTSLRNIEITKPDGTPMTTIGVIELSGDGHTNILRAMGGGLKFKSDTESTFSVRFAGTKFYDGSDVVETLRRLTDVAVGVVNSAVT